MSFFKALVDLGSSELNSMMCRKEYRGRYNNDGRPDVRFDKTPARAAALNRRDSKENNKEK